MVGYYPEIDRDNTRSQTRGHSGEKCGHPRGTAREAISRESLSKAVASLQRLAGNQAVQELLCRGGLGRTLAKRAPVTVQRDVDGDMTIGEQALTTASNYHGQVIGKLAPYTQGVRGLDDSGDGRLEQYAARMAAGFKVWADNYYNKAQAYLYEGDIASTRTDLHRSPNVFGILGVDTDENPDLELVSEAVDVSTGVVRTAVTDTKSVEIKASTSATYASFDGLVSNGMKQLRKREQTGNFTSLHLMLHNDNPANHWPITDATFGAPPIGGNIANVTPGDWNNRLNVRMAQMKATRHIALPVRVEAFYGGQRYALADV